MVWVLHFAVQCRTDFCTLLARSARKNIPQGQLRTRSWRVSVFPRPIALLPADKYFQSLVLLTHPSSSSCGPGLAGCLGAAAEPPRGPATAARHTLGGKPASAGVARSPECGSGCVSGGIRRSLSGLVRYPHGLAQLGGAFGQRCRAAVRCGSSPDVLPQVWNMKEETCVYVTWGQGCGSLWAQGYGHGG